MASTRRREEPPSKRRRPATTPEAREHEMVSLAMDLAEKQIREGTASSQVLTHYLKAGSLREQLEQERITHENDLLQAKREAMQAQKRIEELYESAIGAMRSYQGATPEDLPDVED